MAARQLQNEFTMSRLCDKDIIFTETDRRIQNVALGLYYIYVGIHDSLLKVEVNFNWTQRIGLVNLSTWRRRKFQIQVI